MLARCPGASLQVHTSGTPSLFRPSVTHPLHRMRAWRSLRCSRILKSMSVAPSAAWRCCCFPGCLARICVLLTSFSTLQELSECIKDCLELMAIAQTTSSSNAPRFKAVFKKFSHSTYSQVQLSRIRRTLLSSSAHASSPSVKSPPAVSWLKMCFDAGHGFGPLARHRHLGPASGLG